MHVHPDWPTITAIVNTYDRPVKLKRALASVIVQDFKDFEVIVIHDGPMNQETKDVCDEAVKEFEKRDVHCAVLALSENSGYQCVPKNSATWMARGDYVAYLDDDNEWTPTHLTVLFNAIEEGHKWPDLVYGRREYIIEDGCDNEKLAQGPSPLVEFTDEAVEAMGKSPMYNFIDTSDALIAKGAIWRMFLATGSMWNEELRRFGDWEFFLRGIAFSGWRGKAVDEVVQKYYWHGENLQLTRPAQESPKEVPA
jgi:glycosyltransferase involved in cell wall biosynthesis